MKLITRHIDQITRLCEKYHVENLYIFGSAAKNTSTDRSDIDFLVNFKDIPIENYADNYFDFKSSLEKVLSREVDIIEEKTLSNPYLIESINKSKILIYGRETEKMAL